MGNNTPGNRREDVASARLSTQEEEERRALMPINIGESIASLSQRQLHLDRACFITGNIHRDLSSSVPFRMRLPI